MNSNKLQIKSILIAFILVFTLSTSAQNTKRGFKLLEKGDYEKALELFKEANGENSENPAALLGLSLVLADDSSELFNIIEAWKYASHLKEKIESLTTEETEYIGEYFYNTEARHISRPVKKKVEYAVETVEAKLIKYVREENNLEIVYKVLKEFPDFRYYDNVLHIRNQLEYRKYEKQNTLEGYLTFIREFPEAAQIEKAKRNRNKLAFEKTCQVNTVEAYRKFMLEYPDATENNLAIKKLHAVAFQQAKQANTIQAMDKFITDFPDALEISEAKIIQKQLLYEYAKKIQTLQAYNDFIRKYPDGQQYIDIFNLKSLDNGMRFLKNHPVASNNILWSRSFEEEENEEFTSCMTVDTMNSYFIGGTVFRSDTGFTDAWIVKLNADGKMLWNKYIGEGYNDEINLIGISNKNDIIGAGYTWMGMDSISRESWLFKLNNDGQKIWSKTLGKMHINSILPVKSGPIYLGGYLVNDSLQQLYSILVLNESGKRLWGRTYTGKGQIIAIAECPDQKLAITGTGWRAKIDPKGYIIWETSFANNDSIIASYVLPKGELCYLGIRNHTKLVYLKINGDNKTLLDKELGLPEVKMHVNSLIGGEHNMLIALITFETHQSINWINASTGELTASSRLPNGVNFTHIRTDRNNNLLLEACNGEIIVVKNNGTAF